MGCSACPCSGCQGTGHAAAKGSGTRAAKAVEQKPPTTAWSSTAPLGRGPTQGRAHSRNKAGPCWQTDNPDWSILSFADIKHGHAGTLQGEEQLRKRHCRLVSGRPPLHGDRLLKGSSCHLPESNSPPPGMCAGISQVPSLPVYQEGKEGRNSGKTEEPSCLPGETGKAKAGQAPSADPRMRDNAVTNKPKKAMIQEESPKQQYIWVQKRGRK